MTGPDNGTRPRISRSELRRLREALANSGTPLTVGIGAPESTPRTAPSATVLVVCTGNVCRSPMAEVLLRAALRDLRVGTRSAGTHALVDHPMTPQARRLAVEHGADAADADDHRARLLDEATLDEADLVLTMAREHRSHAVQLAPAALQRTFTMREFARLAASLSDAEIGAGVSAAGPDAGARLRLLARLVGGQRGLVAADAGGDDVIDPYRRSDETYARSASQLVPAVAEATRAIRAALA